MRRPKRSIGLVAMVVALALATVAACSAGTITSRPAAKGSGGGTLVMGAEMEPDCADWLGSCAGSAWGTWAIQEHTIPRVFDYAKKQGVWTEVPSPLLTEMPTVADVGGKQVVTYKISPKAVWSDGVPITSTDFEYTWNQVVTGEDIYDQSGYASIESVDDSDPKTAVVTFSEPYASWRTLFAAYGVLPSHLLEGKDRAAEMNDGYAWSGGPWFADWERGEQVTLTPNPKYWGKKAKIDKVVFKFIANTSAAFKAFKNGEVLAIYPQPQPDAVEQIEGGIPDTKAIVNVVTGNTEALWINNDAAPFDSLAVRQAFAYAIDRDLIIKRLFGGIGVEHALQTLNPPSQARYADTEAYAGYTRNLKKVNQLMKGDGWAKNDDGVWEKDGQAAEITLNTTPGDQRRRLTGQILQEMLKKAGFALTVKTNPSFFSEQLPTGDYQVALYATVATSLDPGLCVIACSKYIPGPSNDDSGQNFQRIDVAALDPLLETVDTAYDPTERIKAAKAADVVMAENQVSLPLDSLPNIALWSRRIVGPVGDNPILAMFWNMNEWSLKKKG